MVEQSPEKACVGGSIPSLATTLNGVVINKLAKRKKVVSPQKVFGHKLVIPRKDIWLRLEERGKAGKC